MTKGLGTTHLSGEQISALTLMTDPDFLPKIMQLYGSMDSSVLNLLLNFFPNMRLAKNDKVTWADVGSDFEENFVISAAVVVGNQVTLTYSASDMQTINGVTMSPFVVGDDVAVYDPTTGFEAVGKIRLKNEAANPHIIVVENLNTGENFTTYATVGATVIAAGHSVSEASIAGKGIIRDIRSYENTMGFTRGDFTITDAAKFDVSYFDWKGADGRTTKYYTDGMERLNAMRFLKNIALQIMIGRQSNLDMVGADGVVYKVRGTKGFVPQIRENGFNLPYSPLPTVDDLYAISNIGRDRGVRNMYKAEAGSDYMNYIQQSVVRAFPNGGIEYKEKEDKALDLRVGKFYLGDFEFQFQGNDIFNHKEMLGNRAFGYRGLAIYAPTGGRVDALTGEMIENMSLSYKTPVGEGNEGRIAGVGKPFYAMWSTGGAANSNKDGDRVKRTHYIGHVRPEIRGAEQFVLHTEPR